MSTGAIIILIVAVVIVLAAAGWLVFERMRGARLRERFGPEYERALADGQSRRAAERELAARERRHRGYDIKPLPADVRMRYEQHWVVIQQRFVDDPTRSVFEADRLVSAVMAERGYPTDGYDQQLADLSVRHASVLDHYRSGHDIHERHTETPVSTEELREAVLHYRTLVRELLREEPEPEPEAPEPEAERAIEPAAESEPEPEDEREPEVERKPAAAERKPEVERTAAEA
jgi:hypothetical protein